MSERLSGRKPGDPQSYREGFIKNRYIGRTFIMPGQAVRKNQYVKCLAPSIWSFEVRTCGYALFLEALQRIRGKRVPAYAMSPKHED